MINLIPKEDWILIDPNPFLFKKCQDVVFPLSDDDQILVNKMVSYIDACYNQQYQQYHILPGIAIAANQVGLDKKVIYVHFNDGKEHKYLLANPKIIANSIGKCYLKNGEGCLSVRQTIKGHVARFNKIKVQAIDMLNNNQDTIINAEALLSICLQHEIDHLSGILFYQKIDKKKRFLDNDKTYIVY